MRHGLIVLACLLVSAAAPAEQIADEQKPVRVALAKLYPNLEVRAINDTPIAGLYEVYTTSSANNNIIYFYPERELLVFGEIYTKEGTSLTREAKSRHEASLLSELDLPLDKALKLGDGPKKIIEFTDPDCPYCQAFHQYIGNDPLVTRYVFFTPLRQLHPQAPAKAIHILCAEDREAAFNAVYAQQVSEYQTCEAGEKLLAVHETASSQVGVTGTPTLLLGDSRLVRGFDKGQVAQWLND